MEYKFLIQMMRSCYAYNCLYKNNRYIADYKCLPKFDQVFDKYKKYLENNYKVTPDTYTDREGLTYNSLTKNSD